MAQAASELCNLWHPTDHAAEQGASTPLLTATERPHLYAIAGRSARDSDRGTASRGGSPGQQAATNPPDSPLTCSGPTLNPGETARGDTPPFLMTTAMTRVRPACLNFAAEIDHLRRPERRGRHRRSAPAVQSGWPSRTPVTAKWSLCPSASAGGARIPNATT